MNKRKRKAIGIVQAVMAIALCIAMGTTAAYPNNSKATAEMVGKTIGGSLIKTDKDASELRSKYFSSDVVKTSAKTYEGKRWIIVGLEGGDLYSAYETEGAADEEFSEYVSSGRGISLKNAIDREHSEFLKKLDAKGIKYDYKYSYSVLNNGVALKVDADGYNAIAKMSEVKSIEFSERYAEPQVAVKNDANVYTTGIYDSSDINEKGEGMVVAVLDTGLDYSHEAFQTMPKSPSWSKADVAAKIANAKADGKTFYAQADVNDVYYNAKIPYAYDYADDDADVYPSYSTHGTHVAGIVAGKSDYVVNEETSEKFIGVAPEAQLVICKVFTDNLDSDGLGGADTIDIISAVSDCVALGVDVINMSLGSSAGFAKESDDNENDRLLNKIYASVKEAGISLVVAASNDFSSGYGGGNGTNLATNPDSGTVGSPSTYDSALSVASINGQKSAYIQANDDENQVAFITEASDGDGNELHFVEQLYKLAGKTSGELRYKYVVIGGVGRATNYTTRLKKELQDKGEYDGTIALVKRGDTTFEEKVRNAMDAGADAVIIYNNVSGTIRMSLGEVNNPVPTCAITMDAGKKIVEGARRNVGVMQINSTFEAGPFMSDFSSWGPMPDLQLKPEITAHGGEITSAVPGGYDVYSGTSMAAPNMAGAIALLRQNLKKQGLSGKELTARVNQVLMSTATIAKNAEDNPYSPRKQGAGLAGIKNAIETESYITVNDKDGNVRDKTKIELYDDKAKTGVYEFEFTINNISGNEETYSPKVYVMTETLASDNKTVAEKADMLDDSTIEIWKDGVKTDGNITVPGNGTTTVKVRITLSAATKTKLDKNFKNGMYIEGFVSLTGEGDTKVTIGLPYLAFYGDWNDAPLFDYSIYDIAESEKDTSIPAEDKLKASAAETRVLGRYFDDKYIIALGSYLYSMSETDVQIYAEKEKAAVSIFDEENDRTIYEVYMVYAGLLRGANTMEIEVKDSATGEVLFQKTQKKVSKSYAAGGSNRGAAITLEIDPKEWNLKNNSTYEVRLKGTLDYAGGENANNNEFDFTFTIDYEAPQILDYRIRFDPYTENKKVKYNIYMDVDVQDNQYVMDVMPCYVRNDKGTNRLTLATEYPVPVYGGKGEKSTVTIDITDYYETLVKSGEMYLTVEDYAMNQTMYKVSLENATEYPEGVTLSTADGKLRETGETETGKDSDGTEYKYPVYDLELSRNELYAATVTTTPDATMSQTLSWVSADGSEKVTVKGTEIYAKASGNATLYLKSGTGTDATTYAKLNVYVGSAEMSQAVIDKIELESVFNASNYVTDIDGGATLTIHPNQTIQIKPSVSPWYITDVEYKYTSSNVNLITVDELGNITAGNRKGNASVTVTVTDKRAGMSKTMKKTVQVTVGDIYRISNYTLYDYYGGENCEIPKDKNVMYLDEDCFKNNTTIKRIVLPGTLTEIPKNAFEGCVNLEEVVIPSQLTTINEGAFKNCKQLKKITLIKFTDRENVVHDEYYGALTVGKSAFENCTKLTDIENSGRLTTAYDSAFAGCTSLKSIDITELRVTGREVFRGCTALETVNTSEYTNIGESMFEGCTSLRSFTYYGTYLKAGVFMGCTNMTQIIFATKESFNGIGTSALAETKIESVKLPSGKYTVEENAFGGCKLLKTLDIDEAEVEFAQKAFAGAIRFESGKTSGFRVNGTANGENAKYKTVDGVLYNREMTKLIAVPEQTSEYELPATVTELGAGSMSGLAITGTIDLGNVTKLGAYALSSSGYTSVKLNPGIKTIPEGLFAGMAKLKTVEGIESVEEIGAYAFRNSGVESIEFPKLKKIGEYAFGNAKLKTITAENLEEIGANAFASTRLTAARFAKASKLGERAFENCTTLREVTLGGVTETGAYVFRNTPNLESVEYGAGTTEIGAYAFYSTRVRSNLRRVKFTNVAKISEFAFYNSGALEALDLIGTTEIGDYAFYGCAGLKAVNFGTVEKIGAGAFSGTNITTAELTKATEIGANAFNNVPLESVTFGALRYVGKYAFSGTKLEEVELPASFDSVAYEYKWNDYDEKGRLTEVRVRKETSYGEGAFANIKTLKSITANGKNIYSESGVLLAKTADGIVVLQYPTKKEGESYITPDGTVAIADSAFENVENLKEIEFSHTMKKVGIYAFYKSSVTKYTFNSVEAPELMSEYVDASAIADNTIEKVLFGRGSTSYLGATIYYANFFDYVAKRIYNDVFTAAYKTADFGLTAIIPKNGTGYDNQVWANFFTIEKTEENKADETTNAFKQALAKVKAEKSVAEISAAATKAEIEKISELAEKAREAFNLIGKPEQLELVEGELEELTTYESALRAKKAELGEAVKVKEFMISSSPKKIRYVSGESFDGTGMVLKLIFEDKSELVVKDYVVDKTVLKYGDDRIVISCEYDGEKYTVEQLLNVERASESGSDSESGSESGSESEPSESTSGEESGSEPGSGNESGQNKGCAAVFGIVGGIAAAIVAAVAVAAIMFTKKKKSNGKEADDER